MRTSLFVLSLVFSACSLSKSASVAHYDTTTTSSQTSTNGNVASASGTTSHSITALEYAQQELQRLREWEQAQLQAEYDAAMREMEFEIAEAALLLEFCDWFCVDQCVAATFGAYAKAACLEQCGCYEGDYQHLAPSAYSNAVPIHSLQSLYSVYYYDDSTTDPTAEYFAEGNASTTTTTTTTTASHSAQAHSSGHAEGEVESSSSSSHTHSGSTVSCSDTIETPESASQQLSQEVKDAMVEAVLHEIFVLAAESALSGKSSIQFQTSSASIKNDFHPQIQQVVDEEWSHTTSSSSKDGEAQSTQTTASTTTSTSVSKEASASVSKEASASVSKESSASASTSASHTTTEAHSVNKTSNISHDHDHEATIHHHVEPEVEEEEVVEEKVTTTSTTTSTTTEVSVEQSAEAEAEKEETPAKNTTSTSNKTSQVMTADISVDKVSSEKETHNKTTTASTTTTTSTSSNASASAKVEGHVHTKNETTSAPKNTTQKKDVSHTSTNTTHVSKEVEEAPEEEVEEAETNKTHTSHTTTTTTTTIQKEAVIAGSHHEEVESEVEVEHEDVDAECCPHAQISSAELEKVSVQLQTELTLFKEELLVEMRQAISEEIDALWGMHLVDSGIETQPALLELEYEIVEPATHTHTEEEVVVESKNETTVHVHEVHVEANGEVHEVHVEEEASSNTTHHNHTSQVVVEEVSTSTVHTHSGEKQTIDAIVDAEVQNVTHQVEIEKEVSAQLDKLVEHEGHVHEAVKEPVSNHSVLVQEEMEVKQEVVTEVVVQDNETSSEVHHEHNATQNVSVVTEVHIDAHVHDEEAEMEATTHEEEEEVVVEEESSVEHQANTTTTTTTTTTQEVSVEKEHSAAVEADHVHTHEVIVEEAANVTAYIEPEVEVKQNTTVQKETNATTTATITGSKEASTEVEEEVISASGVCEVSTSDVLAVPTVTVQTDYWTVSPCSYIDEHGEIRAGHTQKFVTETITTIQHPSICSLPEDVQVEAKSSEQRNEAGEVVQVTTVVTEQTTVTTNGKQVITIVETTTIDDIKPDEIVQEVQETAVTADYTFTTTDAYVDESETVIEEQTVETAVEQEVEVEAKGEGESHQHVESQTTYTTTTTETQTHEVSAEIDADSQEESAQEKVETTTTKVEEAPVSEQEVATTTTTHTEEVVVQDADASVEKEVVEKKVVDTTETHTTTVQEEPVEEKEVVVEEQQAAAATTTTTQTTTTTSTSEVEVSVTKADEEKAASHTEHETVVHEEKEVEAAPAKEEEVTVTADKHVEAETHKETTTIAIVQETEEIQVGLSKSTLESIHNATKANTTTQEPIPVSDVSSVRTGISKESTITAEEEETVGTLHAEFETASVTKEVKHETCTCADRVETEIAVITKPEWMSCQQWTVFVEETQEWSHELKVQALDAAYVAHKLMVEQSQQAQQYVTIRADFHGQIELDIPVGFYSALLEQQTASAAIEQVGTCQQQQDLEVVYETAEAHSHSEGYNHIHTEPETVQTAIDSSAEAIETELSETLVQIESSIEQDIMALGAMLGCTDTCVNECLATSITSEDKYSCLDICACANHPSALNAEVEQSNMKMYILVLVALACALAAFYIATKKNGQKEIQIGGFDEETLKEPLLAH